MLEENKDKGICCTSIPLLLQDNTDSKYVLDKNTYSDLHKKLTDTKQYLLDFVRILSEPKSVSTIRDTNFRDVDTAINFIDKKGTEEIAWEKTLKAIRTIMVDKIATTKKQFITTSTHLETLRNNLSSTSVLEDKLCLFLQNIDSVATYINSIDKQNNDNNIEYIRTNKQLQNTVSRMYLVCKNDSDTVIVNERINDVTLLLSTLPISFEYNDLLKILNEELGGRIEQSKLLQRYVVYINSLLQNPSDAAVLSNILTEIPDVCIVYIKDNFNIEDINIHTKYNSRVTDKHNVDVKDFLSILKKELPTYKTYIDTLTTIFSKALIDIKTDIETVFTTLLDKLADSFTSGDVKTITYLVNVYVSTIDTVLAGAHYIILTIAYILNKYNNLLYAANILNNIVTHTPALKSILKNEASNIVITHKLFTYDELKK